MSEETLTVAGLAIWIGMTAIGAFLAGWAFRGLWPKIVWQERQVEVEVEVPCKNPKYRRPDVERLIKAAVEFLPFDEEERKQILDHIYKEKTQ